MGEEARRSRGWLGGAALAVAAALILTPIVVRESMRSGRLTCPPMFDDVAYMVDAASRVRTLERRGIGAFVRELESWPPHAPVSSALAGGAIVLFGHVDWGPYAMNAVVAAAWFGLLVYMFRARPLWERAVLLVLAAFMPMTHMAVREFRPDMLAATLLAWAVVVSLEGPLLSMSVRRLAAVGALLGASVVTKSSTSPAAVATLGACCAVSALVEVRRPLGVWAGRTARAAAVILGVAVVAAAPYFAIAGGDVYRYIYDNNFGYRKELWVVPGSVEFHLRYYIDGVGGRFQLGKFAYPILACVVLGAVMARVVGEREKARRSLALAAAILVAFSIAAWNVMKQQFLGLPFQTLLVVAAVLSVRLLAERGPRVAGRASAAGVMLVACAALAARGFDWPNRWPPARHPKIAATAELYRDVNRIIEERTGDGPAMVFVTFVGFVNETNLELAGIRRGASLYCVTRIGATSLAEISGEMARADMVVTAERGTGLVNEGFPCAALLDETVAFMDASPHHVRVYEHAGVGSPAKIIVYARPTAEERALRAGRTSRFRPRRSVGRGRRRG